MNSFEGSSARPLHPEGVRSDFDRTREQVRATRMRVGRLIAQQREQESFGAVGVELELGHALESHLSEPIATDGFGSYRIRTGLIHPNTFSPNMRQRHPSNTATVSFADVIDEATGEFYRLSASGVTRHSETLGGEPIAPDTQPEAWQDFETILTASEKATAE